MMLTRPDRKARPVVREKSSADAPLWRMFEPDFEGMVELISCGEREGFNLEIVGNFRVPTREMLNALVLKGEYGGAAAGGTAAGSTLAGEKRKTDPKVAGAGEGKRRRLQAKRSTGPTQKKPAVTVEPQDKDFSIFDAPSSPLRTTVADAGVTKETAAPFVKVVPDPTVQAEETVGKAASQIFDTVDSSNNLITPNDADDLELRFSDAGKQKSGAESQKSPAAEKVSGSASGGAGYEGTPIQPGESELEYYYRTYTLDRSTSYHRPPGALCRGMILPMILLAARRFWVAWAPHLKLIVPEAARLRAEAEELVKIACAGAEQLEKDRADFEKQKQTEEWATTAELKQVRTLAKLLSDERKSWNEKLSDERKSWKVSWAKQNETLFRVRQELTNAKVANAALGKEKAATEAIAVKAVEAEARVAMALEEAKEAGARAAKALEEAKEREGRVSKALEEANADRTRLNQVVGSLQAEVQTREAKLADVTARVTVAEERANEAVAARDALTSSFNQLETDREWMRCHGIATDLCLPDRTG
ncbi:hypothetical protein HanRHA438_Chr10g0464161 [Helianthus annuus]|nr:hypothetical protein HanRHA438_Chr10g0464161 [Helianthus annuus]